MQLHNVLTFLQSSSLAVLVDGSRYIAMSIQIVHLIALTFLLALVLAFNIRVLRLSLLSLPVAQLAHALAKPFLITLTVAITAGFLLFLPRAETYASNWAFVWKMGLLLVAGVVQFLLLRWSADPSVTQEPSVLFRTGSLVTLVLWISTGVAGRAIGFV